MYFFGGQQVWIIFYIDRECLDWVFDFNFFGFFDKQGGY